MSKIELGGYITRNVFKRDELKDISQIINSEELTKKEYHFDKFADRESIKKAIENDFNTYIILDDNYKPHREFILNHLVENFKKKLEDTMTDIETQIIDTVTIDQFILDIKNFLKSAGEQRTLDTSKYVSTIRSLLQHFDEKKIMVEKYLQEFEKTKNPTNPYVSRFYLQNFRDEMKEIKKEIEKKKGGKRRKSTKKRSKKSSKKSTKKRSTKKSKKRSTKRR